MTGRNQLVDHLNQLQAQLARITSRTPRDVMWEHVRHIRALLVKFERLPLRSEPMYRDTIRVIDEITETVRNAPTAANREWAIANLLGIADQLQEILEKARRRP